MSLSYNDLQTQAWLKFNLTATTGNDLTGATSSRIMAVSLTPAAALTTLVIANAATVTGTGLIHLQAAASGNTAYIFFGAGGVRFATGISYTLAGSGGLGEIYYLLDT